MDGREKNQRKPHSREHANPISVATFSYTCPIFMKGFKKDLKIDDLHEVYSKHKSDKLGNELQEIWNSELQRAARISKRASLLRALVKMFIIPLLTYGLLQAFLEFVIRIIQPLCIFYLISYFTPNPEDKTPVTLTEAYLYALGIVLTSLAQVLIQHPYFLGIQEIGMKIRIACCSLIYRKALKLSKTALGQTTVGEIVNLLSNDVNRFDVAVVFFNNTWIAPIQTVIATYFMYSEVGVSAIIGVIVLLMFIPLHYYLGRLSSKYRSTIAVKTDERVRLMNEVISGIQVIKMYTWEKPFAKLVGLSRRSEIASVRGASYIRGIYLSFMLFSTRTSLFVSILAYVLFGNTINARQVFMLTAFYNVLRQSMTILLPQGLAMLAEARVSITRLNNFLLYDEMGLKTIQNESEISNGFGKVNELERQDVNDLVYAVSLNNATTKWNSTMSEYTLLNVTMNIKRGTLTAIIGPVGSGKSSMLHVLLKELPLLEGKLSVNGKISYASQEPWLFGGSVRQNILFGESMNKLRYSQVVKKCALERDFKLFPYGDKTIVGERGVSLSGGQRARINLARAIYKEADIYLLDDPLSAVDTHVGKELFENCIRDYLREKTVILITHQLQYLQNVKHIFILKNGKIEAEGIFNDLKNSGLDFAKLLKSEVEEEKKEKIISRQTSVTRRTSNSSVNSIEQDYPQEVEEQQSVGSLSSYVYKAYIGSGGGCCLIFFVFFFLIAAQIAATGGDYFITFWTNLEQNRANKTVFNGGYYNHNRTSPKDNSDFWDFSTETSIYVYAGLTIAVIILAITRAFIFFEMCLKASINLHDKMFGSIIHATMRFFNTNTSGRILNRFSKDIGAIDERLPLSLVDSTQIGVSAIAIIVMVGVVNPWLLLPAVIIIILFYFVRVFYMKTSRNLKRLEGVTRSPVFSHLNASLQGLTTIRAFGAQAILEKEFDNYQDLHSSAFFSFAAASTAFGYWLDAICVVYIVLVTFSFLVIGNETYGGNVGLVITQSLGLTGMLQWGMRQTAELENHMTSVERVLEYATVEHEPTLITPDSKKPPATWPDKGEIRFVNLFLYYFTHEPPILKNLNFVIHPLEKIGIVGRTGAGKSSLISALFRLTDTKGSIIIDNVDTMELGLHDLRSKISIIPQEPVLFSGTMKKNLDPFDEYDDEVLWKALEEVELKEVINEMDGGLSTKISEGGSNLSVGQRQLICLARAIVRNNKILVLDEATANVDPQTDNLIQSTIRRKFLNCTVLTIAHRLQTIMDSDRVLVMDAGTVVEFNHPHILLQNQSGVFYGMVQQTGKSMAETLSHIAKDVLIRLMTKQMYDG